MSTSCKRRRSRGPEDTSDDDGAPGPSKQPRTFGGVIPPPVTLQPRENLSPLQLRYEQESSDGSIVSPNRIRAAEQLAIQLQLSYMYPEPSEEDSDSDYEDNDDSSSESTPKETTARRKVTTRIASHQAHHESPEHETSNDPSTTSASSPTKIDTPTPKPRRRKSTELAPASQHTESPIDVPNVPEEPPGSVQSQQQSQIVQQEPQEVQQEPQEVQQEPQEVQQEPPKALRSSDARQQTHAVIDDIFNAYDSSKIGGDSETTQHLATVLEKIPALTQSVSSLIGRPMVAPVSTTARGPAPRNFTVAGRPKVKDLMPKHAKPDEEEETVDTLEHVYTNCYTAFLDFYDLHREHRMFLPENTKPRDGVKALAMTVHDGGACWRLRCSNYAKLVMKNMGSRITTKCCWMTKDPNTFSVQRKLGPRLFSMNWVRLLAFVRLKDGSPEAWEKYIIGEGDDTKRLYQVPFCHDCSNGLSKKGEISCGNGLFHGGFGTPQVNAQQRTCVGGTYKTCKDGGGHQIGDETRYCLFSHRVTGYSKPCKNSKTGPPPLCPGEPGRRCFDPDEER